MSQNHSWGSWGKGEKDVGDALWGVREEERKELHLKGEVPVCVHSVLEDLRRGGGIGQRSGWFTWCSRFKEN